MIWGIYFDPNDPLGLSEKPSSKSLARQGESGIASAVRASIGAGVPLAKPKPQVRPLNKVSSTALAGGVPHAPEHARLRRDPNTLEGAMAIADATLGYPTGSRERERLKYRVQSLLSAGFSGRQALAIAQGKTIGKDRDPSLDVDLGQVAEAGRIRDAGMAGYMSEILGPMSEGIGNIGADIGGALSKVTPQAMVESVIGKLRGEPSDVIEQVGRGVGRLGAGALDLPGSAVLAEQLAKDPLGAAQGLGESIAKTWEPGASIEERVIGAGTGAGLLLGGKALAGKVRARVAPKIPVPDKPSTELPLVEGGARFAPKEPAKMDLSDPLGLNEKPVQRGPVPVAPTPMPFRGTAPDLKAGLKPKAETPTTGAVVGYRNNSRGGVTPGTGTFYSEHPSIAKEYQKIKGGGDLVKETLEFKNPLTIEGNQPDIVKNLDSLPFSDAAKKRIRAAWDATDGEKGYALFDTAIARAAKEAGYDGIIYDSGRAGREFVDLRPTPVPPKTPKPPVKAMQVPKGVNTSGLDSPIRDLDASRYAGPTPRVAPDPIPNVKPKQVGQIALDVSKATGKKIQFGGTSRAKAAGTYYPGNAATTVKYAGDLDTTAHELAHALDDKHGIVAEWAGNRVRSPFDKDLSQFWQHGSVAKSGPRAKLSYRRAEGVAEWIRAWLVNPAEAERMAPGFAGFFKQKVPKEVQSALRSFGDDIRGLAGASAKDQIMASVRWEPPKSGLTEWMKTVRDPGGPGFSVTYWDKVQQKWQDSLKPFTKAVDYLKDQRGVSDLAPSKDPAILARLVNGATSKMDDIFERGMIDAKGKRVTGGFHELMEGLEGKTAAAIQEEMKDVASYMIAQRTLEKQGQLGRQRVSGIGGGITSESQLAAARLREVKADPVRFARIEKAAKAYRDWSDSVLQYLRDKGRISENAYDAIKANNEYYVAMKRIMEVGPEEEIVSYRGRGGKALGSHSQVVQRFKGSTRQIQNPYEALLEATYKAIKEADRNEVQQAFFELAKSDRGMYQGDPRDLASVARRAKASDKNNVQTVFVDGKAQRWVIPDPDLYKAFKGIVDNPANLPGWATLPARVLRWGVTHFPEFVVRNKIRDVLTTSIISEHGTNPIDSFKRAAPGVFDDFRKSGGGQFGAYMKDPSAYYGKMNKAVKDLAASRNTIVLNPVALAGKAGKGYKSLLEGSEVSTRLAEFAKAKKHAIEKMGMGEHDANLYAAAQARDLLDFAVAGDYLKVINQLIPFTNAATQGLARAVKAVRKNPVGTAARWGVYVLIPIAAEKAWNLARGEQKEYEQLPPYQKDLFWNFKVGPDLWLSVPKPFEFGILGSFFGRSLDKALGDENAYEGYARSAIEATSPIGRSEILSGPLSGLVGAAANFDFFRERPIVPPYEEALALKHRNTSKASRLGQAIQYAFGVDARKVDFVIRQQFGYAGKYAVDVSDLGREDKKSVEDKALGMTGVMRSGPVSSSRDVVWLQDYAHEQGISQQKDFKRLRDLISAYYEAKSASEKGRAAEDVRRYASQLRAKWEKEKPEKKPKDAPKSATPPKQRVGAPRISEKIKRNLTPALP